ncbi:hypothetical protein DSM25558_2306 [Agrobacterium sp. DSM 25558]|nr:hypothetical protein DSM25558_2306 [Agrobacterium sp. DSM 25558]
MVIVEYAATPLCPAGHLPHRWGDRQDARSSLKSQGFRLPKGRRESISPLVGEMSGRTEGGSHTHRTHPSSTRCDLTYPERATP